MRIFWLFIVAFGLGEAVAQNKEILFGMEEIPQSILLNPGSKINEKLVVGIPFFSQFHIGAGSSGVSVYDIFGDTGEDINSKIAQKIYEMSDRDFFVVNEQWDLLFVGWRSKRDIFYSAGMYQELDAIAYYPKDLAILAWEGNADFLDYPFDLGQVSATAELLTAFHFGASKAINRKLTLGSRVKIYSSLMHMRSVDNKGTFTTTLAPEDGENIYEHTISNADMLFESSGVMTLGDNFSTGDMIKKAFLGGNLGVGIDVGATYDLNEQWTVAASVLDFGLVFHAKEVESYHAYGSYTLDGIELIFPPLNTGQSTIPYYDNLEDELEKAIPIDTLHSNYTQMRPLKMYASIKFQFGKHASGGVVCDCMNKGGSSPREQAVGAQLFNVWRPKGPQLAGTLFYYRRLFPFLSSKITYTMDSFSFSNLGLGIVGDMGRFNMFFAFNNILTYGNIAKAKSVSLQLGFNIKFDQE